MQKEKILEEVKDVSTPVVPLEPLISFDHWFQLIGKPIHHKLGLKAYANTLGRKRKSEWEALFKNY